MKQPTPKQMSDFYMSLPRQQQCTCSECGMTGPSSEVQPQHPFYAGGKVGTAKCVQCISKHNRERRENRKAEMAALPRCEVPGCKRRGNWKAGQEKVLLCGHHLKAAKIAHQKAVNIATGGVLFLGDQIPSSRDSVLKWATTR